jgi:colanic acid/amylovoran biosynthesis glycosyltransferase
MKLCIAYPNRFSYSETFIHNQIKELKPLCAIYEGWYPAIQSDEKPVLPFPLRFLPVRGTLRNLVPRTYHLIYSRALSQYLKRNQIEIVLAEYGQMGVALADACQLAGIPFVVHFHGADAYEYGILAKYSQRYRSMFHKAAAIVAVSTDMKSQLIQLGAEGDKVIYNPYGVDAQHFHGANPAQKPPVFVAVGRFTEKKAPQHTLAAFAKVREKVPKAKLIMVGAGELWEQSKQLAADLGITSAVEFAGVQPPEKVADISRGARVFVQHSIRAKTGDSEGTPNSVLEASATGLPVVSTQHAGIKDAVVHGETGFLVPEGDVEGMAAYMIRLAQDAVLAGEMGRKGRMFMEQNFSMSQRIQRLKDILASVV